MQISTNRNIFLGLALSLGLLLISSVASFISIRNLIESSKQVRHSHAVINNLAHILLVMTDAETGQRGYLISGNPEFLGPYNLAQGQSATILQEITSLTGDNVIQQKQLAELKNKILLRFQALENNLNEVKNGKAINMPTLSAGKLYMEQIRTLIADMQGTENQLLEKRVERLNSLTDATPILIIISALLALGISIYFYKRLINDLAAKMQLQKELQQLNEETESRIVEMKKVAGEISGGNYISRIDDNKEDSLGNLAYSLNKMAESLKVSFELLESNEWLQTGVAKLNQQMVGEKSIEELTKSILVQLAAYVDSQAAAFYILDDNNRLQLTSGFATQDISHKHTIGKGEGIVGECLQSRKPILISHIDDDVIMVNYGLGKIRPKNIIAIPIYKDEQTIGVLEFASLHAFTPLEISILSNVSDSIGIALHSAINRKKLQVLLEETQAQSEELQSQQHELESINAELEMQSQKLLASEEELRVQQEELMQSNQELEERTFLLEERNQQIRERNSEIQLKSQELEESSNYKSEFLANMSHELRTPLNSILLLSKLMADHPSLEKEYAGYAEVIHNSGQGLLQLIDEILDLSKIEAGKMEMDVTQVTLNQIIKNLETIFIPQIKAKSLQFKIEADNNITHEIFTDQGKLEQILKNLLSNAIKFTNQGKVSLHISESIKGALSFAVSDEGIGIPAEKQSLIFEAFQQADGSTKRMFGGTGLGLSISKHLASLLSGKISVKSKEGKGSTFTITIPKDIRQAPVENNVKEDSQVIQASPKNIETEILGETIIQDDRNLIMAGDSIILIAEDDVPFANILKDYAHKKNYKAIIDTKGDEVVSLAIKYAPTAILLDIQLPVMDGRQILEALKKDKQTNKIPVHIISSLQAKQQVMKMGAEDFISKPVSPGQLNLLFQKLENALLNHPKKVLIVEENIQHAKALNYFLGTHGIITQVTKSIEESVQKLSTTGIDCVILETDTGKDEIFTALKDIKTKEGLEGLPIIVFTGKNLSLKEENRLKEFADSIVIKTAHSYQRILDEASLFLHIVEQKNKKGRRDEKPSSDLNNVLKDKVVLVTDDDVRNIFSLTKALEMQQMKVIAATDGREAMEIFAQKTKVDIVLMDMMMPHLDGYETIGLLRKDNELKKLPIIAVTAKAMKGDREKCIAAGASDYISKPVDVDQLISLLRVWLYDKN
ncbi:MAG: response regulator [Ginsengibacter sp.]